jgi:hypothetical protein
MEAPARSFGWALAALQGGQRVRRAGWNGKGMWLQMIHGDQWWLDRGAGEVANGDLHPRLPFLIMRTADGSVVPWLASQTDMLSADWEAA